ncbi:nitrate reductase cytochrome c-type subunit [Caballeronia sp. J97]|uniref:nitrate reductase cytochrome c-type subunit n=1 Tax=Caballeronia sp. J97 TaxID=2805429 RepID=UPI002AB02815|nr:nitrate reductase cytochrome c-type subunit [Caballeronia sp. J97]
MRTLTAVVIGSFLLLAALAIAQPTIPGLPFHDSLRGTTPLADEPKAPLIAPTENKDVIRGLNYAQQPPTIPHKIDNYQLDKNANRCLACHARSRAEESGAVPVAVSHYMDRDGVVSGHLSPRRYFCTQCHVPQADAKPLVGNTFVAVEDIRQQPARTKKR